jgi:tetratricopeptide (TPR) repeat protein
LAIVHNQNMTEPAADKRTKEDLDREVADAFQKHKSGQVAEAFAVYSDVLRVMPLHADALHYMGLMAQQSGKLEDAMRLIRRSLEVNPENPDALNHLGQVYIRLGDNVSAEQSFRQALDADANHYHAINNLANCLRHAGDLETALELYERANAIEPRNSVCSFNYGITLNALGRHWDAIEWLTKATEYDAANLLAHHHLGVLYEQLGKFEDANASYLAALQIQPQYYESLAALLNSPAHKASEAQINTAREALGKGGLPPDTRIRLEHALGKYFDKAQDYETAFQHFRNSNEFQKAGAKAFDIDDYSRQFDRFIEFYTRENIEHLAQFGSQDKRPIFVVGLPRTGTSLVEQILSSHSEVHGAGELGYMKAIAERVELPADQGGLGGLESPATPFTQESMESLCDDYLDGLTRKSPESATRITDKYPLNCIQLGLISILFPNAKIIHCQREPLDVAISCYTMSFNLGNDFTNDLMHFGQYYKEYRRLMTHWAAVLPTNFLELQYEELIRSPETVSKELIAFCELPWEAACLNFDKNERSVVTPSSWQVRQRIYSTSIERWKNYEKHLVELKSLLQS